MDFQRVNRRFRVYLGGSELEIGSRKRSHLCEVGGSDFAKSEVPSLFRPDSNGSFLPVAINIALS